MQNEFLVSWLPRGLKHNRSAWSRGSFASALVCCLNHAGRPHVIGSEPGSHLRAVRPLGPPLHYIRRQRKFESHLSFAN